MSHLLANMIYDSTVNKTSSYTVPAGKIFVGNLHVGASTQSVFIESTTVTVATSAALTLGPGTTVSGYTGILSGVLLKNPS